MTFLSISRLLGSLLALSLIFGSSFLSHSEETMHIAADDDERNEEEESRATYTPIPSDYILRSGDTVKITVFREDDLATVAKISQDNSIQFPLLGDVVVGNLTIREARERIRALLDADYIVSPQVTVSVEQFAVRSFTILGQVRRPGIYQLPGGGEYSLMEAIGTAGGLGRSANLKKILLRRQVEGLTKEYEINLKEMSKDTARQLYLKNGDVITVTETWW